jgi:hypothetical protein
VSVKQVFVDEQCSLVTLSCLYIAVSFLIFFLFKAIFVTRYEACEIHIKCLAIAGFFGFESLSFRQYTSFNQQAVCAVGKGICAIEGAAYMV